MSDGGALFAAILAAPADDAPRLIYADWLDERGGPGDGAYAEFVRVQIELAKPTLPCRACGGSGRLDADHRPGTIECRACEPWGTGLASRDALRARERELLDAFSGIREGDKSYSNRAAWSMDLRPAIPSHWWEHVTFRRGFVDEVRCTVAAFVGGPCPRCDVSPGVRRYATHGGDWIEDECNACSGTGRTPGLAAALAGWQPVTGVVLTDREPDQPQGPQVGWVKEDGTEETTAALRPDVLPAAMYDLLEGGKTRYDSVEWQWYGVVPAAKAALSAACVAYLRSLADRGRA